MKTFNSDSDFAAALRGTKYREFQRYQFYSLVPYAQAGATTLQLFGDSVSGSVNTQRTNLPKANSFGDVYFLIKAVQTRFYIKTRSILSAVGTDATSILSDFLNGFAQAGVFNFTLDGSTLIQLPKPFLLLAGDDRPAVRSTGDVSLTLTEGTPNTFASNVTAPPWGEPVSQYEGRGVVYLQTPALAINPNASFDCSITYPSGAIAAIAQTAPITSDSVLLVGVEFDGIVARPMQ